ncbi:MAG: hypothetical protein QW797_08105 [Thermoproteota archaeon]
MWGVAEEKMLFVWRDTRNALKSSIKLSLAFSTSQKYKNNGIARKTMQIVRKRKPSGMGSMERKPMEKRLMNVTIKLEKRKAVERLKLIVMREPLSSRVMLIIAVPLPFLGLKLTKDPKATSIRSG